jgi:hypothetical protein
MQTVVEVVRMRKENEEAIEIIKTNCYFNNPLDFDNSIKINRALDMAIKALEEQPCEDCISRQAVLDIFDEVHPMDYNTQAYITNIQNLPSVTPRAESEKMCDMTCKEMNEWAKTFADGLIDGLNGGGEK